MSNGISKAEIVLAAVQATGPVTAYENPQTGKPDIAIWQAHVNQMAQQLTLLTGERSSTMKAIEQIEESKVFTATITKVYLHENSQRVMIEFADGTDKDGNPKEERPARTEIITGNDSARMLANRAKSLVGHRVAVWIQNEVWNDQGHTQRILRHVEDLGVDTTAQAA